MTDVMTPVEWLEQDYDSRAEDENAWPLYTRTFMELIPDAPAWTNERMMRWFPMETASDVGPEYPTALEPASA